MHTSRWLRLFSFLTILALLAGGLPAPAVAQAVDPIVIDGVKEAAWGSALASDPLGDMTEPNLDLQGLYVVEDDANYYIGFDAFASTWGMTYGIYIDTDGVDNSGATSDPWSRAVNAVANHLPEHTLYVFHNDTDTIQDVQLNHWNGSGWSYDTLVSQGGAQAYGAANDWIEYRVPKAALGDAASIALEVFTTGGDGHAQDTVPSDPNVAFTAPDWNGANITTLSNFASFGFDPAALWFLRGDFNGWDTSLPMNDSGTDGDAAANDGVFTAQVAPATAGRYLFKVGAEDWSVSYPPSNSWLVTTSDGELVTVTFDTNSTADGWLPEQYAIGVSANPSSWTAVGNWQNWNNADPATAMQAAGGIYEYTAVIPTPGTYEYKAVATGSWDAIGANSRGVDAATALFTTTIVDQEVILRVDPQAGRVQIEVVPPPAVPALDNNIWWDGLGHNSRDDLYRTPGGAVTTGTPVTIRFRSYKNDLSEVMLRLWSTEANAQTLLPMEKVATTDDAPYGYDYWQVVIPAQNSTTVLYYRFIVRDGSDEDYYEDDDLFDGAWGAAFEDSPDYSYQIDVYLPDYRTPSWMKNAVIYQIYPDRFFNGRTSNDAKTTDPTVYGNTVVKKSWNDLPEGYCRAYQGSATPCNEQAMGRDFFGGDLQGILEKLVYLRSQGVTAIYMNPIFEAPSNHLYDTSNYYQIDRYFGSQADFTKLAIASRLLGMRLILDGVFNHTSSDSLYFDRYSRYATTGAFESQSSPYYPWYTFNSWPNNYVSWWNFDSLPVLTEIQAVRDFIYGSNNSVARTWIRNGASGWRLDVAPDKSHDFWEEFRPRVKSVSSDAVIIGEIWDDASPWLLGDEFDSTMNYRFRRAMLGFLNGQSSDPNQGDIRGLNPEQFNSTMQSIKEDYPAEAFYAMMNLVGSHDTQRILWALTPGARNREEKEFNAANLAEGKAKLKLLAILQMTMPGAPTIYYGDEVGLTGDTDPDDRRPFPWNNQDLSLRSHYQKLGLLRNLYSFLRTGSFDGLYTNNDEGTYAYGRKDGSGAAVIAVNRDTVARTVTIDVAGYLPEGTMLLDALNGGTKRVTGGTITVTVKPRWGVVLVTRGKVDLTAPTAPTGLAATESSGQVALTWNTVNGARGYNVYRSFVMGGGYTRLNSAPLTTTSFIDSTVANGQMYCYVVTALDAAGNESKRSSEVSALPHMLIEWANVQWPATLTHTLSASTRTGDVYGQVYIPDVTNQAGLTTGLKAQLGYGPDGSNPASDAGWVWVDAVFNVDAGNNDEFKASLLPTAAGSFDYAYRYTTTNGREWVYADLDGTGNGYSPDQAGALTVQPSGDTTAPGAPANLQVRVASPTFITLGWDAVPDADLYSYEILRADTSGGPYTLIGSLTAPASEYTDWTVSSGATYFYVVQAVDTSFNRSGNSNEVQASALAREVQVTFTVTVPETTPAGETVYIAGSFQGWAPGATPMTQVDATHWTITLPLTEGSLIEYKYTRGSWDSVEKGAACEEISNRRLTILYGANGTQTHTSDVVATWRSATCGN